MNTYNKIKRNYMNNLYIYYHSIYINFIHMKASLVLLVDISEDINGDFRDSPL